MNPHANSSVTEDGFLEDENTETAGGDWRGEDEDATSGDPGRTTGTAECVDNFQRTGNE